VDAALGKSGPAGRAAGGAVPSRPAVPVT